MWRAIGNRARAALLPPPSFSIHDCTREHIDLVIVEAGPGSRALTRARR
jgi:hypothetical protein